MRTRPLWQLVALPLILQLSLSSSALALRIQAGLESDTHAGLEQSLRFPSGLEERETNTERLRRLAQPTPAGTVGTREDH